MSPRKWERVLDGRTCAFISRIARPVCNVSIFARSGMRSSRSRARFDSTAARCIAGVFDQTPALKTSCALNTAFSTSSWLAHTTLGHQHNLQKWSCVRIDLKGNLRADMLAVCGVLYVYPDRTTDKSRRVQLVTRSGIV